MTHEALEPRIQQLLADALAKEDLALEGLKLKGKPPRGIIEVYVDTPPSAAQTATLDQIAAATHTVSEALDNSDVMDAYASYELEVSTPGVDRPLSAPHHFSRNIGRLILADAAGHAERMCGRIESVDGQSVTLIPQIERKGQAPKLLDKVYIPFVDIKFAQVQVEFNRTA